MKKIIFKYNLESFGGQEILGFIFFTYGLITNTFLMWISGLIFLCLNNLEINVK